MAGELEPLAPEDALEWYLEHRQDDTRYSTQRKQRSALGVFVEWTEQAGIDNLNDLSGRDLLRFKTWRKNETPIETISLNGNLAILRTFLRFCETINAVEDDLADATPMPNVPRNEQISDVVPSNEAVAAMRDYYRRFEYASRHHTQLDLIAEVGIRLGAVRGIDLGDFDAPDQAIHLVHRPEGEDEYGTPLKNGRDGERIINLSLGLTEKIQDYIDHNRNTVRDRFEREPLFTTKVGRVTTATIRRDFYKLTRPCSYSDDCPHERDPTTCEAAKDSNASECPSSFSTHPLRRWSIMRQLDAGVPKEILSDRVDVSVPVLDKHYDQRSEERKSRRRRESLEDHLPEFGS